MREVLCAEVAAQLYAFVETHRTVHSNRGILLHENYTVMLKNQEKKKKPF